MLSALLDKYSVRRSPVTLNVKSSNTMSTTAFTSWRCMRDKSRPLPKYTLSTVDSCMEHYKQLVTGLWMRNWKDSWEATGFISRETPSTNPSVSTVTRAMRRWEVEGKKKKKHQRFLWKLIAEHYVTSWLKETEECWESVCGRGARCAAKISLKPLITLPRTRPLLVLTSRWHPDADGAERIGRASRMKVRCFPAFKQWDEMSHHQHPLYRVCEWCSVSTTTWSTGATTEAHGLERVTAFVLKKWVTPQGDGDNQKLITQLTRQVRQVLGAKLIK